MTRFRSSSPAPSACVTCFTLAALALTALMLIPSHLFARSLPGNHFIVGGESENRYPAVGAIIENNEASCTGTLITPTYVLTAAHCLFGSGQNASFYFGSDARNLSEGTLVPVEAYIPHRLFSDGQFYDIGLIRLREAAPVEPIPYATNLTDTIIGQSPLFVGYGVVDSYSEEAGEKRSVNIPITQLDTDSFTYAGQGVNTCFGDSGGPALLEIDGTLQVLGVTSWGDDYCEEFGVNTRTDTYNDFITCVIEGGSQCGEEVEGNPGGPGNGGPGGGPGGGGGGPGGGGPGGGHGDGDLPDDWCTDGDGWCDEPCDTVDSDCIEGDGQWGPGDEDVSDDDTDSTTDINPGDNAESGDDANSSGPSADSDQDSEGVTSTDGEDGTAGGDKIGDADEGGCAATAPTDLIGLLLLMGLGIIRRRVRHEQQCC